MAYDAGRHVRLGEPCAHARRVARIGVLVAREVERRGIRREAGERLEQVEDSLALDPVRDAEEGGAAALALIGGRPRRGR